MRKIISYVSLFSMMNLILPPFGRTLRLLQIGL
jgi:hypothetical protein